MDVVSRVSAILRRVARVGYRAAGLALGAATAIGCGSSSAAGPVTPADTAVAYVAGQSYLGTNAYVEYLAGNAPVILTAPHGGSLAPSSIPDRTDARCGGSATTVTDL